MLDPISGFALGFLSIGAFMGCLLACLLACLFAGCCSSLSPPQQKECLIKIVEQDGVWYAFEQTKGITVRAETREAVISKMRGALEHAG